MIRMAWPLVDCYVVAFIAAGANHSKRNFYISFVLTLEIASMLDAFAVCCCGCGCFCLFFVVSFC